MDVEKYFSHDLKIVIENVQYSTKVILTSIQNRCQKSIL